MRHWVITAFDKNYNELCKRDGDDDDDWVLHTVHVSFIVCANRDWMQDAHDLEVNRSPLLSGENALSCAD